MNNHEELIRKEVLKLLNETNDSLTLMDLEDSAELESLGLGSIDWARLLAILEIKLESTPFENTVSVTDVSTLGEVIAAYNPYKEKKVTVQTQEPRQARSMKRREARTSKRNRRSNISTKLQSEES